MISDCAVTSGIATVISHVPEISAFSFDVAFTVTTPFAVPVDRSPFSSIVAAALPDFVVTDHVTPLLIASAGVTATFI